MAESDYWMAESDYWMAESDYYRIGEYRIGEYRIGGGEYRAMDIEYRIR